MNNNDKIYKVDNEISNINDKKDVEEKLSYNNITDKINEEKNRIKNIDSLKETFLAINKSFGKLIDLMSLSVKGPQINNTLEEISSNNMATIADVCDTLDFEKEEAKNNLNDLYYKKDNFERDNREKPRKENKDKKE